MLKFTKLLVVLLCVGLQFSALQAQTTILDQSMLTQSSFDTFTAVSVSGAQNWNFDASYGAVCSGYSGGQSYQNEDWLISPPMNLFEMDNVQLNFSHTRGECSGYECRGSGRLV